MERLDIYSLEEYNDIMRRKLISRNHKDYSKKLGSRASIFEEEEKETLLPLPVLDFKAYEEKDATVWRDLHVQYNCAFYSTPVDCVGKVVKVRASNDRIRIYFNGNLVAEHKPAVRKWQKCTLKEHIPGEGEDLHGAYSSKELISWAEKFGPNTVRWVQIELGRFEFEVQSYRPITSVLRMLNKYSSKVAESASEAALASSVFTVKGYKSILSAKSKMHPAKTRSVDLNDVFCTHEESEGMDYEI